MCVCMRVAECCVTYPRLSLRAEQALTALMLLSFLLLSKLSSAVCSLSLKTPSFFSALPDTRSLSLCRFPLCPRFFFSLCPFTSPHFYLFHFFSSLPYFPCPASPSLPLPVPLGHLSFLLPPSLPFFSSPPSPSPALQELGIAVSRLAQRTGRHMGGLFCNPAGHTTLANG